MIVTVVFDISRSRVLLVGTWCAKWGNVWLHNFCLLWFKKEVLAHWPGVLGNRDIFVKSKETVVAVFGNCAVSAQYVVAMAVKTNWDSDCAPNRWSVRQEPWFATDGIFACNDHLLADRVSITETSVGVILQVICNWAADDRNFTTIFEATFAGLYSCLLQPMFTMPIGFKLKTWIGDLLFSS